MNVLARNPQCACMPVCIDKSVCLFPYIVVRQTTQPTNQTNRPTHTHKNQITRVLREREAQAQLVQGRIAARCGEVERAWEARIEQGFDGLLQEVCVCMCVCACVCVCVCLCVRAAGKIDLDPQTVRRSVDGLISHIPGSSACACFVYVRGA
jgi:hypothetical protein